MTGRLRRLTGPALIADHDKRIEQLERRLNTTQTDPGARLRPRTGGGGTYPATLTVAAADALVTSKERADYVCDGTNDDVEINAALLVCSDLAWAGAGGGRVLLSEGNFHLGVDGINPFGTHNNEWANCTLQGQGKRSTVLKHHAPANNNVFGIQVYANGQGVVLADFTLDSTDVLNGGQGIYLQGGQASVYRVRCVNTGDQGYGVIQVRGVENRVVDCEIVSPTGAGAGIYVNGTYSLIQGNRTENTAGPGLDGYGAGRSTIVNNQFVNVNVNGIDPFAILVGGDCVVTGNICIGNSVAATIYSGAGSQVANNVLL